MLPHYGGRCDLLHVASASQTKNISQGAILQNDNPTQYMIDMQVIVAISLQTYGTHTVLFGLLTAQ
jgi:hypothetical protein